MLTLMNFTSSGVFGKSFRTKQTPDRPITYFGRFSLGKEQLLPRHALRGRQTSMNSILLNTDCLVSYVYVIPEPASELIHHPVNQGLNRQTDNIRYHDLITKIQGSVPAHRSRLSWSLYRYTFCVHPDNIGPNFITVR